MKITSQIITAATTAFLAGQIQCFATFTTSSAMPITHQVTVQLIQVADNAGSDPATVFGSTTERNSIEGFVDDIWGQAGIDVNFLSNVVSYNNSFALDGMTTATDFNSVYVNAFINGGVLNSDPNVINMFLVDVIPGATQGPNTANGLAFLGVSGIAQYIGAGLLGTEAGRQIAASVVAHEIGHNLGLDHIAASQNLMRVDADSGIVQGQFLNTSQITTALDSQFSVAVVPEPSTYTLLMGGLLSLGFITHRRSLCSKKS